MEHVKVTSRAFLEKKERTEKISMVTCYDYPTALIIDKTDIDAVLVGDSLGMVILGYNSTLPVTMEEIIHHTKAVSRGLKRAYLIADMPMGSFHISVEDTLKNAIRLIKEAGAEAVKLEGGAKRNCIIKKLVEAEIPVMAHIGLTPQSIHMLGGYRIQGRNPKQAEKLLEDALAVEAAGAFAIVMECIPTVLAKEITGKLTIPTIGIGSGPHCDGQILVLQDMLGIWEKTQYKFVKKYSCLYKEISQALNQYDQEVKEGIFPAVEHSFNE
ncbi:MAG: 3-methyl-2-oxobutanoate hydroxymethyltransferase [Candidatus Fischerbacteria bacterium RBG_13_37_8]|uniref:3-methyl-2-oxobutanoate hydroxymethyltransferase n=1 Tax=Candidatus Fischerbacteria bacterium RBG_13_37_8 TaxID=1817863 RepID=A0A1F5VM93_9BACT|nr:MAG: 3-methyl-2-oxobutanoate hydroxymethyltransferase [Candidatus Fischerbacteria bacterium RBG_13_37_8]